MKTLIAVLTGCLMLVLLAFAPGATGAEAASRYAANYCKTRYNLCLARCPDRVRCFSRCLTQYKYCVPPAPSLGDLL
ncbi:hypothetical protein [Methyloceanibacter sp.]|uniref:hypothetical protein n=1 Tax=Methyloceanibacter sp. TaxID=1965321 RepID=UPI002D5D860D|nr:hypothetical protein [Methyloceanibacter sp.]HZP09215.1 hypothetical protein [Methyloceanibacter sp.]